MPSGEEDKEAEELKRLALKVGRSIEAWYGGGSVTWTMTSSLALGVGPTAGMMLRLHRRRLTKRQEGWHVPEPATTLAEKLCRLGREGVAEPEELRVLCARADSLEEVARVGEVLAADGRTADLGVALYALARATLIICRGSAGNAPRSTLRLLSRAACLLSEHLSAGSEEALKEASVVAVDALNEAEELAEGAGQGSPDL